MRGVTGTHQKRSATGRELNRRDFLRTGGAGLAGAVLLGVAGCGGQSGGQGGGGSNIQLSVADPESSSVGQTALHYADLVEQKTNGQVTVEVVPDGTLFGGDQEAAVNQLGDGSLDAAILSTSVYASFEARMNAISLPYLFSSVEELNEYLSGEPGQQLLNSLNELYTEGLTLMPRTLRHVTNSARPIESPQNLEGLAIRTPNNPLWVRFFEEIGANPTPMDFSEVYTALETGTIDGQENPVEVPVANNFYEVQQYISKTGHIADAYVLGINQDLWEGLSSEHQQAMSEAAEETVQWKTEYDLEEEQAAFDLLREEGMEVNELSEEGRTEFQRIAENLYPQLEDEIGPQFMSTTLEFVQG